jgi:hypothetical protein
VRLYLGKTTTQKRAGGIAQDIGPEFKHQYCKKKKRNTIICFSKEVIFR